MTNEQDTAAVRTELIGRVQRSWDELQAAVAGLDDHRLSALGPEGWSAKDHLAHLARWEEYMLAVLDGRDGRAELEVDTDERRETDAINAALQKSDAGLPAAEVRSRLAETHARMVARLRSLDGAELTSRLDHIAGNTHEHFDEHAGWIRALTSTPA
jgi:uncharacterized damage-inducible protein DinB